MAVPRKISRTELAAATAEETTTTTPTAAVMSLTDNNGSTTTTTTTATPTITGKRFPPNADVVHEVNGNFGLWQLRTILLIFLCKIPSAWFMACVIYTAPTPQRGDYYCKPPAAYNFSAANLQDNNQTTFTNSTQVVPWIRVQQQPTLDVRHTDRQFYLGPCNIYEEYLERNFAAKYANYTNPFDVPPNATKVTTVNVIPCEHFEHNSHYKSLVTQFDLVCSRQLLISMTQSFHALGAFCGGFVALQALKYVSPRRLMLIGMLFQIFCGNLTGLVSSFQLHCYFRCLTSLFCALMYTSGQIILSDITAGKAKTIVTTLFELFWSIGLILLPGISIFFDNWSYLYVAISSSVIILVFLHRWIADSPRWLLRHNKIERTLSLLLESAAFNNRPVPLTLISQLEKYAKKLQAEQPAGYWSIWDGKLKKLYLISIHWVWIGAAILFNVMLLMIRSLGVEHIHVNTACLGFSEMIGVFLGLYFILYTRRRWLWAGYLMLTAALLTYFVWLVPHTIKENRQVGLSMVFWILLKLANSATLSVLTTCTGELVTADKRAMLMLSVVCVSRIGLIIGPFISTLLVFHHLIPITVFATFGVINGSLMCLLNSNFWNNEQPRIQKVLTPNTYRRNSAIVLLRRNSSNSDLSCNPTIQTELCELPMSISVSDLWRIDLQCESMLEKTAMQQDDKKINADLTKKRNLNETKNL